MKKAKIMLMSIAIVAVVGGALAFKANKLQGYCIDTIQTPNAKGDLTDVQHCSQFTRSRIVGNVLKYEFPTSGTNCTGVTNCEADFINNE